MNEVLHEAARQSTHGWLVGAVTIVFMSLFIAIIVWLLASQPKSELDEAARLPLDDEDD